MIVVLSYSIKLHMTFTIYKQYSMLNAEYFKFFEVLYRTTIQYF